jgi:stage III sporulation protein AB
MFILKCINLVLIIFIPSYIGFYKARNFKNRTDELKKIKMALSVFKSKIEFTYEPIVEIFMRNFKKCL